MARHRAAQRLGIAGAALGVIAGTVQALAGARIPEWTGAKQEPGALGLLTIALSLLAGYAANRQARPGTTVGSRAAWVAALLIPALLCFSTVGRLWYLPGPLLLLAGIWSINSVRDTADLIGRNWARCLLAVLGAAELLMAAGAVPVLMVVGSLGGAALLGAATIARSKASLAALVLLGTVPFAVLAWTAIIPVLLLLAAVAVTLPLLRHPPRTAGARP